MRKQLVTFCFLGMLILRLIYGFFCGVPAAQDDQGVLLEPRQFLEERLMHVFVEPQASLATGILLGSRATIPYDLKNDFKAVGLMHVVAVSGFNMVIIVTVMTELLIMFNRRKSSVVALGGIIFFTLLVGASAAVVRAAVMSALRLVAWLIGRPQAASRLFLLTIGLMLMWSPSLLWDDIGFQLSAAATAGLIWLSKPIAARMKWITEKCGLRENLSTTLAATLVTTPIVWFHFQTFSLLSIPVNLLVLPMVSWLMLGSFLSLIFGMLTALPTSYLFSLMIFLVEKGAVLERALHALW